MNILYISNILIKYLDFFTDLEIVNKIYRLQDVFKLLHIPYESIYHRLSKVVSVLS